VVDRTLPAARSVVGAATVPPVARGCSTGAGCCATLAPVIVGLSMAGVSPTRLGSIDTTTGSRRGSPDPLADRFVASPASPLPVPPPTHSQGSGTFRRLTTRSVPAATKATFTPTERTSSDPA
jgi:hypothetical protein